MHVCPGNQYTVSPHQDLLDVPGTCHPVASMHQMSEQTVVAKMQGDSDTHHCSIVPPTN